MKRLAADKIHGKTVPINGTVCRRFLMGMEPHLPPPLSPPLLPQAFSYTRMEPVGIVAGITPWNFPSPAFAVKVRGGGLRRLFVPCR